MKKITRKVYDESGTETSALGLPCKTVTDYWNGSIDSDGVYIDDAFDIEEVNISDDHSTGLLPLLAEITKTRNAELYIPTSFDIPTISGYKINSDGSVDWNKEMADTLTEVTLSTPVYVDDIPVYKVWKCNGDVNCLHLNSFVKTQDKKEQYLTEANCIYKVLSGTEVDNIKSLLGLTSVGSELSINTKDFDYEHCVAISKKTDYIIGLFSKDNLDKLVGITSITLGKNGCITDTMLNFASKYNVQDNLNTMLSDYTLVDYIIFSGNQYIDTGLYVGQDTSDIILNCEITGGATGSSSGSNGKTLINARFFSSSNFISIACGKSEWAWRIDNPTSTNHRFEWDYVNNMLYYDEDSYVMGNDYPGLVTFALGAWKEGSTMYYKMNGKVYYFAVFESGIPTVIYIPSIRNSDSAVGFYDIVNDTFHVSDNAAFTYNSTVEFNDKISEIYTDLNK